MLNQNPVIDAAMRRSRASPPASQNVVINAAVKAAMGAVITEAGEPSNDMSPQAVSDTAPALEAAITKAVEASPEVQHASNTEHWWQKRSRWSAIVSIVLVIAAPAFTYAGIDIDPATKEFIVTSLTTLGSIVAGYLALRAGIATKPLFVPDEKLPYPRNRG